MRCLLFCCTALAVWGQQPTFRTTVPIVMAPTTVVGPDGRYINGLGIEDFTLLADGRPQRIEFETSDTIGAPLSVIIAIQANNTAPAAVKKIQKVGSMIEPLITGERGRAAILSFGSELVVVRDFTNDADQLTRAFRGLRTQSGMQARMLDAVSEAVRLFEARPASERRVLVVISETRDRGSTTKLEEAVKAVQQAGISVFTVTYSAYTTPFTAKPSALPMSEGGLDIIGTIGELVRLGKANTSELLAEMSGGRRIPFTRLRGLELGITSLGEELHSQYILSYTDTACEPGFHRIEVKVKGRADAVVRSRYGYWTGAETCPAEPSR